MLQEFSDESKPCLIASGVCPRHGITHGAEAERLRGGLERLVKDNQQSVPVNLLQDLLDGVDAGDSLAFLEAQDASRDVPYREGLPSPQMVRAHAQRYELSDGPGGRWQVINDGEFLMLDLDEEDGVITARMSGVTGDPFDLDDLCLEGPGCAVFRPTDPNATPLPWPEVAGG